MTDPAFISLDSESLDGHPAAGEATDFDGPASAPLTDAEKLDYLYQTAVEVRTLISKITEEDVQKARSTMRNPLIRKALGL